MKVSDKLKQRLKIKEGKLWRHQNKHKQGVMRCPTCIRMENVIGTLKDAIQECDKELKKGREKLINKIQDMYSRNHDMYAGDTLNFYKWLEFLKGENKE